MQTSPLTSIELLESLTNAGECIAILKHNTSCPISKGVLQGLENSEVGIPGVKGLFILDLLAYRDISNAITSKFKVEHQSPQLLIVQKGACHYSEWGYDISAEAAASHMS